MAWGIRKHTNKTPKMHRQGNQLVDRTGKPAGMSKVEFMLSQKEAKDRLAQSQRHQTALNQQLGKKHRDVEAEAYTEVRHRSIWDW